MFSCKIIKKRRNSQRFCPSFSWINSFIGAARLPLLLKDRTRPFSVQKRMFFIRNRCRSSKICKFWAEFPDFYQEFANSEQNFPIFIKNLRILSRNRCILSRICEFWAENENFYREFWNSERNFPFSAKNSRILYKIFCFLLRIPKFLTQYSVFCLETKNSLQKLPLVVQKLEFQSRNYRFPD